MIVVVTAVVVFVSALSYHLSSLLLELSLYLEITPEWIELKSLDFEDSLHLATTSVLKFGRIVGWIRLKTFRST